MAGSTKGERYLLIFLGGGAILVLGCVPVRTDNGEHCRSPKGGLEVTMAIGSRLVPPTV
jgi:hypothetical protein